MIQRIQSCVIILEERRDIISYTMLSVRHGLDFMFHYQGILYDESRDVYVRAKYNCKYKVKCDSEGEGFLEEQLPPVLLKQLEDKKRLLPPMMVPTLINQIDR